MFETRNRWLKRSAWIVIPLIALMLFSADINIAKAATTEQSYELLDYKIEAVVHKDHSYDITKKMKVNIPNDMNSLSVTVPTGKYRITDLEVENTDFSVDTKKENKVVTIDSEKKLKKGVHTFVMTYKIQEYKDHSVKYDMFYLDALPPNWDVPIGNFEFRLVLPEDFPWDDLQYYGGQFNTQDVQGKLSYVVENNTIVMSGSKLPPDFGVTFKAELPDGYWQDPLDNDWTAQLAAVLMLVTLTLVLLLWLIFGRDPKFVRKRINQPIQGLSTADVGYLFTGHAQIKDVLSLIIHLGIRGNLRISEYAPKKYRLFKLKEPSIDEDRYIRNIYNTLFEGVYEGRAVEMEDLGPRLGKVMRDVEMSVASGYSSKDMLACTRASKIARMVSTVVLSVTVGAIMILVDLHNYQDLQYITPAIMVLLTFVSVTVITNRFDTQYEQRTATFHATMLFSGLAYAAVLVYAAFRMYQASGKLLIAGIIIMAGAFAVMLICLMKARAKGNARIVNRLLGMRQFIDKAETKDVSEMQTYDSNYYYTMLPYAYVFSLMEKWTQKFRWIRVPEADWFTDDIEGHAVPLNMQQNSTELFAVRLHQFSRTIESEFHAMTRKHRFFG